MQLEMSQRTIEGILILDCKGYIAFGEESARLHDVLRTLIVKDSKIVVNLAGVNHIDSGGLGTLVALVNSARVTNSSIVLAGLNSRVRDLLEITRLANFFSVSENVDTAIQEFQSEAS